MSPEGVRLPSQELTGRHGQEATLTWAASRSLCGHVFRRSSIRGVCNADIACDAKTSAAPVRPTLKSCRRFDTPPDERTG
jgi:hypothetical protein